MSNRARVVWSEGMLLTPQHFQLLDRYHEEWAAELFHATRAHAYGLTQVQLNAEAIQNGKIVLHEAAGVFPSGTPFSLPDQDLTPAARDLAPHFPVQEGRVRVHLGLRLPRPEEAQFEASPEGQSIARYHLEESELPDATTGNDKRRVQLCRTNMRLLFPSDDLGAYDHLPIAEIERQNDRFVLRGKYIPPCLGIGASRELHRALTTLHEVLLTKTRDLRAQRGPGGSLAGFAIDDVQSFWMLALVGSYVPVLAHFQRVAAAHPEALYLALARLAGQLMAIDPAREEERRIPAYDHDNLEYTFAGLEEYIRDRLGKFTPTYHAIELTRRDDLVCTGIIAHDTDLDPKTPLFLGLSATMDSERLEDAVLRRVKISSPERIDDIVIRALPGVRLRRVRTMPAAYLGNPGFIYFLIMKEDQEWNHVAGAHAIAIYVPRELPSARLELVAVGS